MMGCDGCCRCLGWLVFLNCDFGDFGMVGVMIADGWRCMNPLRLAALDASPFCEAKGGGMVVGAAGFGRVITYGSG